MGEVKKSVRPIVYKSASVRNLPVPVQSVSQPNSVHIMDTEGDPFETEEEMAYHRAIGELAKAELECSSRIEFLQREASRLASVLSGGDSGGGDDGPAVDLVNKTVRTVHRDLSTNLNQSWVDTLKKNVTSWVGHNQTAVPGSSDNSTFVRECPPCEECRPCSVDPGTSGGSSSDGCGPPLVAVPGEHSDAFEVPMAFLVGVASTLLMLVLAVIIGAIIRYLPLIVTGILILTSLCMVWYCSSRYPESARRLGARAWEGLRSGVSAVVERLFRRDHPEVSVKYCKCRRICEEIVLKKAKIKKELESNGWVYCFSQTPSFSIFFCLTQFIILLYSLTMSFPDLSPSIITTFLLSISLVSHSSCSLSILSAYSSVRWLSPSLFLKEILSIATATDVLTYTIPSNSRLTVLFSVSSFSQFSRRPFSTSDM